LVALHCLCGTFSLKGMAPVRSLAELRGVLSRWDKSSRSQRQQFLKEFIQNAKNMTVGPALEPSHLSYQTRKHSTFFPLPSILLHPPPSSSFLLPPSSFLLPPFSLLFVPPPSPLPASGHFWWLLRTNNSCGRHWHVKPIAAPPTLSGSRSSLPCAGT
jgi:hypothetical protein